MSEPKYYKAFIYMAKLLKALDKVGLKDLEVDTLPDGYEALAMSWMSKGKILSLTLYSDGNMPVCYARKDRKPRTILFSLKKHRPLDVAKYIKRYVELVDLEEGE